MSSVGWRIWVWKYDEGWALYWDSCNEVINVELSIKGVVSGFWSSDCRKAGHDSQQDACSSDTDLGRVPISAGLSLGKGDILPLIWVRNVSDGCDSIYYLPLWCFVNGVIVYPGKYILLSE